MAITLGDINVTLQEQNVTLKEQSQTTKSLNSNISTLVKQIQGQRLDDREREIESKGKRAADTAGGRARSAGAKASGGGGIPGIGLLAGGLGAIGGLMGSAMGMLQNIPLIGGLLTKLISFGSFFARRAPFMIAAYLIIDNIESIQKIFENITNSSLFTSLKETATDLVTSVFGFESWGEMFKAFTQKIKEGFQGLERLTSGDFEGASENILGIGTLLGSLFLMFGKTRKMLFGLVTGAGKLIANVGSKVLGLGAAGAAGAKAVDAGADAANAAKKLDAVAGGAKPAAQIGSAVKPTVAAGQFKTADLPGMQGGAQGPSSQMPKPAGGGLSAAMKKFPKLFKVLGFLQKVPGLGKALAIAPLLAAVAAGAGPDKIAPLAGGIIGGALGWKAGGILGGLLGAAGGPAAIVTGLGGALLGGFMGDRLGTSIAQWATGQKADGMPWGFGWIDDLLNGSKGDSGGGGDGATSAGAVSGAASGAAQKASAAQPTMTKSSPQTAPAVAKLASENAANSSKPIVVVGGSTQTVNNVSSTNQGISLPSPRPFDMGDPFFSGRGPAY